MFLKKICEESIPEATTQSPVIREASFSWVQFPSMNNHPLVATRAQSIKLVHIHTELEGGCVFFGSKLLLYS